MLPSRELEYRILKFALSRFPEWKPTTLAQLTNTVEWNNQSEVVDALKRLHKQGYIELRKFGKRPGSSGPYTGNDEHFFYLDGFEIKIAPDGRPHLEELEQAKSAEAVATAPVPVAEVFSKKVMDWSLIHPSITAIAKRRFDDGHFADAVESALKEVNKRVKDHVKAQTGNELDGADLMCNAFSLKRPVITLADLTTETGKSIQQGYMQMFAGAMTGIRNPKAHENVIIDDGRAIHFLFVASLLMYKLDEVSIPPIPRSEPPQRQVRVIEPEVRRIAPPVKNPKADLRNEILLLIADHEDTGSNEFLDDKIIAERFKVDVREIHKHLLILEEQGQLKLSKAMGPSYGARLTTKGLLSVESLRTSATSPS